MHIPLEIGKKFISVCVKEKIPESKNKLKMQFPNDHSPARSASTHTDRSFITEAKKVGQTKAVYRLKKNLLAEKLRFFENFRGWARCPGLPYMQKKMVKIHDFND